MVAMLAMKVGLVADIHGNVAALAAVLAGARREGVERLLCAGDVVGYYYEPGACLELLEPWPVDSVRGNHEDLLDALAARPSLGPGTHARYGSALASAVIGLSPRQRASLTALPACRDLTIEGMRVLLCHGAPWDNDLYVYPDAPAATFERCANTGADVVVLGHTHYRFTKTSGSTTIINPGSVGQPRDRKPGAAWALLDTADGSCRAFSEVYDSAPLAARARAADPHLPYLWEVLSRQ